MKCRKGMLSLLQTLREHNVKTESWKKQHQKHRKVSVLWREHWVSRYILISVRKVCTSSCLPGCRRALTVSVPSAPSDDVTEVGSTSSGSWHLCVNVFMTEPSCANCWSVVMVRVSLASARLIPMAAAFLRRGDFAYLFCMDFDLVVGCGHDDVFRRKVSHVNCELVWVTEGLDISSPT